MANSYGTWTSDVRPSSGAAWKQNAHAREVFRGIDRLDEALSAIMDPDNPTAGLAVSYPLDIDGYELILDADGDTSITADTDDQVDFKIGGVDCFRLTPDGIETLVDGLTVQSSADVTAVLNVLHSAGHQETGYGLYAKKNAVANLDSSCVAHYVGLTNDSADTSGSTVTHTAFKIENAYTMSSGTSKTAIGLLVDISSTNHANQYAALFLGGRLGLNTSTPRRRADFLDASNPQLRLTHTDNSTA